MWEIREKREKWEETYRIIESNFKALEAEYAREVPYFRYRIEPNRAYIKFGVMSSDNRLGVIAIENIKGSGDHATGSFYTYELILMGITVSDLIDLSNFEINSEELATVLSRGYVKMRGKIVHDYGEDIITEGNKGKLINMFNELRAKMYERM